MVSFSQQTKEELYRTETESPCCVRAEYAGLLLFGANLDRYGEDEAMLQTLNVLDENGKLCYRIATETVREECCRRALVKGAFLSAGTVIDPRKNYNLEIVTPHKELSEDMLRLLQEIGFPFRLVLRKSKYVLYLKNSEAIADFLSYIGAFQAQMEVLNVKIEKEIHNEFNRAANSETANLEKTINAAVEQIQAIMILDKMVGLDNLPDDLREVAYLRLEHKEMSLAELGTLVEPPLSKSGVNHRLKRLMKMALQES
ncbi:MAG: DNA-binding protein WhiA [Clostridia bacterium]|nr:DNA-binding protein WhiA [Clostridia bacterium]